MKKFLWWGISLCLCIGLQTTIFAQSNLSIGSSHQPLKYQIAFIDPRFQLTKEQLIEVSQQAAEIWHKETGKTYFIYDSEAQLSINLIYDDHQIIKSEQQENLNALLQKQKQWRIKNEEIILNKQEIDQLSSDLNKKRISLKAEFEHYQRDVTDFNQGEHRYYLADELKERQNQLQQISGNLQNESNNLNFKIQLLNIKIKELNQEQSDLTTLMTQFKLEQKASIQTFHKGLFSQNQIQIYGYASLNDLRLTLAHEFGHALGLKHTTDPKSLMYPRLKEQDIHNFKLTDSDLELLGSIYSSIKENH
ncbi:matrixin family metalloprotease [Acinetobacter sp. V91_7]|uniref:matrixin family metalloprotease n=1 Tax=unclassified Acinetobacter TaxID=196816 RepID=UPI00287EE40F|nr:MULTISPECIES: matrixin family metalloprotease [unclassified Acinetobacter]MDS7934397.1 matrixin family metalloprotease [Acinetobacter sp. V91_4B]MDS7961930.1 matrixin family metalloprotease [Acinetobacter sp. V91_7]MDS8028637.1 matrixin family metalloprotease [Acinetobacter sp. V91_13]